MSIVFSMINTLLSVVSYIFPNSEQFRLCLNSLNSIWFSIDSLIPPQVAIVMTFLGVSFCVKVLVHH